MTERTIEPFDDDLRAFVDSVWAMLAEKQFANWVGRKSNEYLRECKAAGGTSDGFWEWLNTAEAYRVRGKILLNEAAYIEERLDFVRSYSANGDDCMAEVPGRALGVSPDRALAEYDRRRTDGTLPLTPKH